MAKKGGWCLECEQEGRDPQHNRRTTLCGRHYQRHYRASKQGIASNASYRDRVKQRENEPGRAGWCPECEKEGSNPQHSRTTRLCPRHWREKWRSTPEGERMYREQNVRRAAKKKTIANIVAQHRDS